MTNDEARDAIQQMSLEPSQVSIDVLASVALHLLEQVEELQAEARKQRAEAADAWVAARSTP